MSKFSKKKHHRVIVEPKLGTQMIAVVDTNI